MLTRIAVLVSGGGTNLQALLDAERAGKIPSGRIVLVLSSNPGAYALERAKRAGVATAVVSRRGSPQPEFETAISAELEKCGADMLILAGFMSILSADFTRAWPNRIINVHPSLIPSFCGKGCYGLHVHEQALARGVKVTGATVHYVNEIPDGGEIILQKAVPVLPGDTPEILQRRVMTEAEWQLLPQAAETVAARIAAEKDCTPTQCGADGRDGQMDVYAIGTIRDALGASAYPGRGIIIGRTADGTHAVAAYFIMGRSRNSRNRIFTLDGDTLYTRPYDESLVEDPSLIIYAAVRRYQNRLIVTNGDQTDTVYDGLCAGKSFPEALQSRCFEPDAPNFTPRISGMLTFADGDFGYSMSILKSADRDGTACSRYCFDYPSVAGVGHFIHTYMGDGSPLPTFCGEPERVAVCNDIDGLTDTIWSSLDADNRISLWVQTIDLASGECEHRIINKNGGDN